MKRDENDALLTLKAFHSQILKFRNEPFEDLVEKMIPFLIEHLNAYIHANVPLFRQLNESDLFRCRNTNEKINPVFKELTSPPKEKTIDLRMSRKGTSYFYGSLDKDTPIEEATAPNSKYSYLAHFRNNRSLILFDLTGLNIDGDSGDEPLIKSAKHFLQYYTQYISLPNNGNPEEYLPTQVITHFIKECVKQHFPDGEVKNVDGVLFISSKTKKENVVLFYDDSSSAQILTLVDCTLNENE